MVKVLMTALAALLGALPAAYAQHEGHAMHHPMPMQDVPALGASAAFDARGTLWAVAKDGGHVVLRRSTDFGRSWSAPVRVNRVPEGIGAEGDARPKIAAGMRRELYVTWTRPLSKPYTGDVRFARSLDGGATFADPVTVNDDRQEITHRFDSIAVTPTGKVFMAWIDKRDGVAAGGAGVGYAGAAVYYAVSQDRGATFGPNYKLADHSCECCRIALLPVSGNRVIALWRHVFPPNVRDHALGVLEANGGGGEMRRATFDDWRIDACPHHGPSLAQGANGALHAVWFTQGTRGAGVFYGRLREGGIDGQRRVGGDTAEHADLAASGRSVAIAWKEFDGERTQLKAMTSIDGGTTWREHTLATTADAADQPRLLQYRGRYYVFWHRLREPFSVVAVP